jgi:hypothetical protein
MFEHRLVMERAIGRYLTPSEVVDHIDELTLHNVPSNLRVFDKNGDHLRETITGHTKLMSRSGRVNVMTRNLRREDFEPVDIYYQRRKRGDVRLRQILLAALSLGIDSPFLLGTHYHLRKKQIDVSSRSTIEHALAELDQRWAWDLSR